MSREAMFDSNSDQLVIDLQVIHDQQTIKSFNNSFNKPFPQVGSVVLRLVGFGVLMWWDSTLQKHMLETLPSKSHIMDVCLR
jgi:hypothetical protein